MKALRDQNIVHRDLKPGNILIKKDPISGKMKVSCNIMLFVCLFRSICCYHCV